MRGGLKLLTGVELADMGKLYRRVTSDLSYVKANSTNEELVIYLNELAGRAHGILYANAPTSSTHSIISFLLRGFPVLFREKRRYMAVAAAIMILSSVFAALIVADNPAKAAYFLPPQPQISSDEKPGNPAPSTFSSMLMVNNIRVSLLAFAGGATCGLLTVYVLIKNGLMVGAFLVKPYSFLRDPLDIAAFIFPHGFIELLAICISAAAGLILGWSLISPGNLSRWDSLRKASRDALPLVAGVAVMLVIAGCIESFIARSATPRDIKLSVAALSAIGLVLYFGWAGRKESSPR